MDNKNKYDITDISNLPTKRAAYSDRTALLMAKLSSIAYTEFGENNYSELENKLRNINFKLVGYPVSRNDTQAFVAIPKKDDIPKFAVICFRGTEIFEFEDWKTNLDIRQIAIKDPKNTERIIGHIHRGYYEAYQSKDGIINGNENVNAVNGPVKDSVAYEINKRLCKCSHKEDLVSHQDYEKHCNCEFKNVPIYITGHSMGGAIAMVATWYITMSRLAACYTFGAPKIGDDGPLGRFRTPIYRVVNGLDPVPDLPPSYVNVDIWEILKHIFLTKILCSDKTVPENGYTPYGVKKYIPTYPNDIDLRILPHISICHVVQRFLTTPFSKSRQFLEYHNVYEYVKKLEIIANNRNSKQK